jgi:hypothetical protein
LNVATEVIVISQPCTGRRSAHVLIESAGRISRLQWATITGRGLGEVTLEHRGEPDEIREQAIAYVRTMPERITELTIDHAEVS